LEIRFGRFNLEEFWDAGVELFPVSGLLGSRMYAEKGIIPLVVLCRKFWMVKMLDFMLDLSSEGMRSRSMLDRSNLSGSSL